jgi:hypothetical protein
MWLALLLAVVVFVTLLILRPVRSQGSVARALPPAALVSGEYRIWVPGVDEDGQEGRYYLVAYGTGKQQSQATASDSSVSSAILPVSGLLFFYFRPAGDVGGITALTAPLYLNPIGGIANTAFTDSFKVQLLGGKMLIAPSGTNFANTALSICNDATQCIPGLVRFDNRIGSTVFNYEREAGGYRVYQDGEPRNYLIVGNPLCPVGTAPAEAPQLVLDAYQFIRRSCAALPSGQPGGPRFATVSATSASILHFAK